MQIPEALRAITASLTGGRVDERHKSRIVKRVSNGASTMHKPIDPSDLPGGIRTLMSRHGKRYITRNSRCLCHSGKRFKRCCGANVKGVKK